MSNFHLYPDHICIRKKILYAPWAFHALIMYNKLRKLKRA